MILADTSYFLGLLYPRDHLHEQALTQSKRQEIRLITTTWVLMEVANAMSAPLDRQIFVEFMRCFSRAAKARILPANEDWFAHGFDLYRRRPDKAWSLTDCISFLVMWELGIDEALTADHHFAQAGFRVLLQN